MEELDDLQIELESLLAAATLRMRQLKSEIKILSDIQDNKKEKKVSRGVSKKKFNDMKEDPELSTRASLQVQPAFEYL